MRVKWNRRLDGGVVARPGVDGLETHPEFDDNGVDVVVKSATLSVFPTPVGVAQGSNSNGGFFSLFGLRRHGSSRRSETDAQSTCSVSSNLTEVSTNGGFQRRVSLPARFKRRHQQQIADDCDDEDDNNERRTATNGDTISECDFKVPQVPPKKNKSTSFLRRADKSVSKGLFSSLRGKRTVVTDNDDGSRTNGSGGSVTGGIGPDSTLTIRDDRQCHVFREVFPAVEPSTAPLNVSKSECSLSGCQPTDTETQQQHSANLSHSIKSLGEPVTCDRVPPPVKSNLFSSARSFFTRNSNSSSKKSVYLDAPDNADDGHHLRRCVSVGDAHVSRTNRTKKSSISSELALGGGGVSANSSDSHIPTGDGSGDTNPRGEEKESTRKLVKPSKKKSGFFSALKLSGAKHAAESPIPQLDSKKSHKKRAQTSKIPRPNSASSGHSSNIPTLVVVDDDHKNSRDATSTRYVLHSVPPLQERASVTTDCDASPMYVAEISAGHVPGPLVKSLPNVEDTVTRVPSGKVNVPMTEIEAIVVVPPNSARVVENDASSSCVESVRPKQPCPTNEISVSLPNCLSSRLSCDSISVNGDGNNNNKMRRFVTSRNEGTSLGEPVITVSSDVGDYHHYLDSTAFPPFPVQFCEESLTDYYYPPLPTMVKCTRISNERSLVSSDSGVSNHSRDRTVEKIQSLARRGCQASSNDEYNAKTCIPVLEDVTAARHRFSGVKEEEDDDAIGIISVSEQIGIGSAAPLPFVEDVPSTQNNSRGIIDTPLVVERRLFFTTVDPSSRVQQPETLQRSRSAGNVVEGGRNGSETIFHDDEETVVSHHHQSRFRGSLRLRHGGGGGRSQLCESDGISGHTSSHVSSACPDDDDMAKTTFSEPGVQTIHVDCNRATASNSCERRPGGDNTESELGPTTLDVHIEQQGVDISTDIRIQEQCSDNGVVNGFDTNTAVLRCVSAKLPEDSKSAIVFPENSDIRECSAGVTDCDVVESVKNAVVDAADLKCEPIRLLEVPDTSTGARCHVHVSPPPDVVPDEKDVLPSSSSSQKAAAPGILYCSGDATCGVRKGKCKCAVPCYRTDISGSNLDCSVSFGDEPPHRTNFLYVKCASMDNIPTLADAASKMVRTTKHSSCSLLKTDDTKIAALMGFEPSRSARESDIATAGSETGDRSSLVTPLSDSVGEFSSRVEDDYSADTTSLAEIESVHSDVISVEESSVASDQRQLLRDFGFFGGGPTNRPRQSSLPSSSSPLPYKAVGRVRCPAAAAGSDKKSVANAGSCGTRFTGASSSSSNHHQRPQGKSRIPRKQGNAQRPLIAPRPVRPPMWLSKAELTQEIQHLTNLCETRTKELNRLKMEARKVSTGFDALAVVINFMNSDLKAFDNPSLAAEVKELQSKLVEAKEELAHYKNEVEDLNSSHVKEMELLSEKMQKEHNDIVEKVTIKHEAKMLKLKEKHDIEVKSMTDALRASCEEEKLQNARMVDDLKKELLKQREEMEIFHQHELDDLEERYMEKQNSLTAEIEKLQKKCEDAQLLSNNMEEALQKDTDSKLQWLTSKRQDLQNEVDSLKAVLEIKNNELHSLRKENLGMQKELEELHVSREKIKMLQARAEDLQALMNEKVRIERQLSNEHQVMKETYEREAKINRRLSMENEELLWRLKQVSETSLMTVPLPDEPETNEADASTEVSSSCVPETFEEEAVAPLSPAKSPRPPSATRPVFFTYMNEEELSSLSPGSPRTQYKRIQPSCKSQSPARQQFKSPSRPSPRRSRGSSSDLSPQSRGDTPRKMAKRSNSLRDAPNQFKTAEGSKEKIQNGNITSTNLIVTDSLVSSASSENSVFEHCLFEEQNEEMCISLKMLEEHRTADFILDVSSLSCNSQGEWVSEPADAGSSSRDVESCIVDPEYIDPKSYYHMTFPVKDSVQDVDAADDLRREANDTKSESLQGVCDGRLSLIE